MSETCSQCGQLIYVKGDHVQYRGRHGIITNTAGPGDSRVYVQWELPQGDWLPMTVLNRLEPS